MCWPKVARSIWPIGLLALSGCGDSSSLPDPYCERVERAVGSAEDTVLPSAVDQLGKSQGAHTCSWTWRDPSPVAGSDQAEAEVSAEISYELVGSSVLSEARSIDGQVSNCDSVLHSALSVTVRIDGETKMDLRSVPITFHPVGTAVAQVQVDEMIDLGLRWNPGWVVRSTELVLIVQSTGDSGGGLSVSAVSDRGQSVQVGAADWFCAAGAPE